MNKNLNDLQDFFNELSTIKYVTVLNSQMNIDNVVYDIVYYIDKDRIVPFNYTLVLHVDLSDNMFHMKVYINSGTFLYERKFRTSHSGIEMLNEFFEIEELRYFMLSNNYCSLNDGMLDNKLDCGLSLDFDKLKYFYTLVGLDDYKSFMKLHFLVGSLNIFTKVSNNKLFITRFYFNEYDLLMDVKDINGKVYTFHFYLTNPSTRIFFDLYNFEDRILQHKRFFMDEVSMSKFIDINF